MNPGTRARRGGQRLHTQSDGRPSAPVDERLPGIHPGRLGTANVPRAEESKCASPKARRRNRQILEPPKAPAARIARSDSLPCELVWNFGKGEWSESAWSLTIMPPVCRLAKSGSQ